MDLRSKCVLIALAIVVGFCGTVPRAADRSPSEPSTVLNLRLTASTELSGASARALVNESSAIWRDANVQLRWLSDETGEGERSLRVLVARRAVTASSAHSWPVAELLRFPDSTAIAMASIAGALRIVHGDADRHLLDLTPMHQFKLGVVLGRAVAHEIGHYLLQTNSHTQHGLMRASIDAREFADLRTGAFRLDRESQASLAARAFALHGEE